MIKGNSLCLKKLPVRPFLKAFETACPLALDILPSPFHLELLPKKAVFPHFLALSPVFFTRASAGEYGGYSVIAASGSYMEIFIISLITNARYLLMGCAMSQKFSPKTGLAKRLLVGLGITDEIFGISIAWPGYLKPVYTYGAMLISTPMWAAGTALGIVAGSVLPVKVVSALSVALYGMFLAIIVPPSKKDKAVAVSVVASFILSFICTYAPVVSKISSGTRTIILTILIAGVAAFLKPVEVKNEEDSENE